ncbi:MAG TPA: cobalamin-binding protein [Alphaproteobacteria bacterium]
MSSNVAITPPRVVSLLPSAAEIVAALGGLDLLVGRSHECDYPPAVAALPACTHLQRPLAGDSAAIHRSVMETIEQALSVFAVDAEALRALKPDLIVTQSQCDVCAVAESDLRAALADWLGAPPAVVSLAPATLAEVADSFRQVAAALGRPAAGEALAQALAARLAAVARRVQGLAQPRVATLEWLSPLMTAGNWVPELIATAGGENLFGAAGAHSPWLEWADVAQADPDVIVVMPCGFDLEKSTAEAAAALPALKGWRDLRAVRAGRVAVVDGNRFFNRPGPRLADSAEILAEIFHPQAAAFGHEGDGWRWLPL